MAPPDATRPSAEDNLHLGCQWRVPSLGVKLELYNTAGRHAMGVAGMHLVNHIRGEHEVQGKRAVGRAKRWMIEADAHSKEKEQHCTLVCKAKTLLALSDMLLTFVVPENYYRAISAASNAKARPVYEVIDWICVASLVLSVRVGFARLTHTVECLSSALELSLSSHLLTPTLLLLCILPQVVQCQPSYAKIPCPLFPHPGANEAMSVEIAKQWETPSVDKITREAQENRVQKLVVFCNLRASIAHAFFALFTLYFCTSSLISHFFCITVFCFFVPCFHCISCMFCEQVLAVSAFSTSEAKLAQELVRAHLNTERLVDCRMFLTTLFRCFVIETSALFFVVSLFLVYFD